MLGLAAKAIADLVSARCPGRRHSILASTRRPERLFGNLPRNFIMPPLIPKGTGHATATVIQKRRSGPTASMQKVQRDIAAMLLMAMLV